MVICRNCRSPRPDGTKFCSTCGYKISELPIAPFFYENVSSNSSAICNDEEMEQSVDTPSEWDDASPTDPSLPVYEADFQPLFAYGGRQRTQPIDLQPQLTHRERQRTQPMDPLHLHPQSFHGMRQNTLPMDLIQLQPQAVPIVHEKALTDHPKHLKKVQSRRNVSYRIIAILSLLLIFFVGAAFIYVSFYRSSNNNVATTIISNATLVTSGKAMPGQTLQVIGNHFPPSQTVLVTLDDQPLVKNEARTYTPHLSAPSLSLVRLSSTNISGTPIPIHADGTFTVVIHIGTNWKVGSTHHLSVYNQQGKELKSLNLPIEANDLMK